VDNRSMDLDNSIFQPQVMQSNEVDMNAKKNNFYSLSDVRVDVDSSLSLFLQLTQNSAVSVEQTQAAFDGFGATNAFASQAIGNSLPTWVADNQALINREVRRIIVASIIKTLRNRSIPEILAAATSYNPTQCA